LLVSLLLLLLLRRGSGLCCVLFVYSMLFSGEKNEIERTKEEERNADRWVGPKGSRRRRRVPHGDGISVRATPPP
jgi:hypothetical protein